MSDNGQTGEWEQLGHTEQVRRAVRKVVCEGGSHIEHALVKEISVLRGEVFINDGPMNARIRDLEARLAASEAGAAAMREALIGYAYADDGSPERCFCYDVQDGIHDRECIRARAALASDAGRNYRNAILEDAAKVADAAAKMFRDESDSLASIDGGAGIQVAVLRTVKAEALTQFAAAIRALKDGT